jgi:hypothetical protein
MGKKVRYLSNEKNPVSEIDYAYAGLLLDIIEAKSNWSIKRHLDMIRYRMEAADEDLFYKLAAIEHHIDSLGWSAKTNEDMLREQISRMPGGTGKIEFQMLCGYASIRARDALGNLSVLAENFDPGYPAYTDDDPDPRHSLLQSITRECGFIDSYHSKTVHDALRHLPYPQPIFVLEYLLTIVKAIPRYRGHSRNTNGNHNFDDAGYAQLPF